jgi:hypothetical protein
LPFDTWAIGTHDEGSVDEAKKNLRLKALDMLSAVDQELGWDSPPKWIWPEEKLVDGWRLVCTSVACPEQYDVFDPDGKQVGYLRLRNSWFRADYPEHGGPTVYSAQTKGDGLFDDNERELQIRAAIKALQSWHAEHAHGS